MLDEVKTARRPRAEARPRRGDRHPGRGGLLPARGHAQRRGRRPRRRPRRRHAARQARRPTRSRARSRGRPSRRVPAPRLVKTLEGATIALVTDGGLVPRGNPDGIEALNATRYGAYSIEGKASLEAAQYDNPHRGYDTTWVKQDPHRLVPVDVARELEQSGAIGKLHETVYSTVGRRHHPRPQRAHGTGDRGEAARRRRRRRHPHLDLRDEHSLRRSDRPGAGARGAADRAGLDHDAGRRDGGRQPHRVRPRASFTRSATPTSRPTTRRRCAGASSSRRCRRSGPRSSRPTVFTRE